MLTWVSRKAQSACVFYIWSHSSNVLSHAFRAETLPARTVRWNPQTLVKNPNSSDVCILQSHFITLSFLWSPCPQTILLNFTILLQGLKMHVWHWNSLFYSDPPTLICKILIILAYLAKKVIKPLPWMSLIEHSTEICLREILSDLDHKTGIFYFIVFHFSSLLFLMSCW